MPAHIMRDSAGRILHYSAKEAPSRERMREILKQAEKDGAKRAALVADVGQFQAYENKEAVRQTVRDYRNTPASLRARMEGPASLHATDAILHELKLASGAERAEKLGRFNLNFSY